VKNQFKVRPDGVVEVRLQRGLAMLIHLADLPRVAALPGTWCAYQRANYPVYAVMRFSAGGRRMTVWAHRLIAATRAGLEQGLGIDDRNHNGLDNRRANLREVRHARNMLNRRGAQRGSKSGMLGAHFKRQTGRWQACAIGNGAKHHLGYFDTPEEAAAARRRFLAVHRLAKK